MIPERLRWLVADGSPTAELAARFRDAGHDLYLVGGSLRDALLGREVEDLDFTTDARPPAIRGLLEGWADSVFGMGEAYGTIGARMGDWIFEITTFRSEVYRDESRKPEVTFSDRIEDDLVRRDFTINAMALALPATETIDPCGGLADLAAGVLRTPGRPEDSFSDDPLRMLRLFRFQATLGFAPDPEALEAVRAMGGRLGIVSPERIRDEFSKLITASDPGPALTELVASGLSDHFIPELSRLAMSQDPVHKHKDVLAHTIAVTEKTSPRLRLRMAALLHDIGKPDTRDFDDDGVTFHHHEVVGARMARDRLRALRFPNDLVADVRQLVFLHLRPHTLKMGWTDSAVRRYVRDAGDVLEDLNELVRCDVTTGNARRASAIQRRIDELEERIVELREREAIESLRAPINGNDVISYLGIRPGPIVGDIMDMLLEKRIDDGEYSAAEAYQLTRAWAVDHGLDDPGPGPTIEEE
ncbi:MAG TPA: CCA tRNA nucleotidyltransferase [Acidimicrobiia bacterium]|nr:CCA tRNA nucleotidyltransferase [Acidimicrobiia bacterium]